MIRVFVYLPSFEQKLSIIASSLGPFVTLGDPTGARHSGAARFQVQSESTWQPLVERLVVDSQLVLLRSDDTESLTWELGKLCALGQTSKLVLYLQFEGGKKSEVRRLQVERFLELVTSVLNLERGQRVNENGFYTITAEGQLFKHSSFAEIVQARGGKVERSQWRAIGKAIWPFARSNIPIKPLLVRNWIIRITAVWAVACFVSVVAHWIRHAYITSASVGHNYLSSIGLVEDYRPSLDHATQWPLAIALGLFAGWLSRKWSAWGSTHFLILGGLMTVFGLMSVFQIETCISNLADPIACSDIWSIGNIADPILWKEYISVLIDTPYFILGATPIGVLTAYVAWVAGLSDVEVGFDGKGR